MMDITGAVAVERNYTYSTVESVGGFVNFTQNEANTCEAANEAVKTKAVTKGNISGQSQTRESRDKNVQPLTRENLDSITISLNKFMQSLNTDIHFEVHEKTKRLIVQVIDNSSNKVLKEFPPHQLLDTIAAIQERIGFLLDKRA